MAEEAGRYSLILEAVMKAKIIAVYTAKFSKLKGRGKESRTAIIISIEMGIRLLSATELPGRAVQSFSIPFFVALIKGDRKNAVFMP